VGVSPLLFIQCVDHFVCPIQGGFLLFLSSKIIMIYAFKDYILGFHYNTSFLSVNYVSFILNALRGSFDVCKCTCLQ
jgi:hypothetical protein